MLIFSETRVVPPMVNIMTLEDNNGNYYYVHRDLYDQAVILSDSYQDNPMGFRLMLAGAHAKECAERFFKEAPKPINILGYFLELIDSTEEFETMEDMCGALHVMSLTLNFRQFLKVNMDLRKSVRYSLSIREEYQLSYDRFFTEAMSYEDYSQRLTSGYAPAQSASYYSNDDASASDIDLNDFDEEIDWGSISVDEEETGTATEEKPEVIEEPEEEPEEAPKPKSGLDLIKGW